MNYLVEENKKTKVIKVNNQDFIFYGGNQSWWKDVNVSLQKYGCGVIAMCNTELSIRGELEAEQAGIDNSSENDVYTEKDYIEISDYKKYIEDRYNKCYRFPMKPPFNAMGLMPWTMARGIKDFYGQFGIKVKSKWAPTLSKNKIIDNISEMVDKGIPIPASYYVFNKKNKLMFYSYDEKKNEIKESSGCTSHYFNITGIIHIETNNEKNTYLSVSSWGELYYIKFDDWVKKLSYFTNILHIKRL